MSIFIIFAIIITSLAFLISCIASYKSKKTPKHDPCKFTTDTTGRKYVLDEDTYNLMCIFCQLSVEEQEVFAKFCRDSLEKQKADEIARIKIKISQQKEQG